MIDNQKERKKKIKQIIKRKRKKKIPRPSLKPLYVTPWVYAARVFNAPDSDLTRRRSDHIQLDNTLLVKPD
jgi:hypothetical protein